MFLYLLVESCIAFGILEMQLGHNVKTIERMLRDVRRVFNTPSIPKMFPSVVDYFHGFFVETFLKGGFGLRSGVSFSYRARAV